MRDPKRIPVILKAVEDFWEQHPDLRLGQIIVAATPQLYDPFYIEDEVLIAELKKL